MLFKLKKVNGEWTTIDELHDTNINRTALSGGAIGKSIPSYTKKLSPAIRATAFRLEFYGHGWFDATDIRIYTKEFAGGDEEKNTRSPNRHISGGRSNSPVTAGIGKRRKPGRTIQSGKGKQRQSNGPVSANNGLAALVLGKGLYQPTEKMELQFKVSSQQDAWVGLYPIKTKHDYDASTLTWQNFDNKSKGILTFTAPSNEGEYEFRSYERTNHKELVSVKFTVRKGH